MVRVPDYCKESAPFTRRELIEHLESHRDRNPSGVWWEPPQTTCISGYFL